MNAGKLQEAFRELMKDTGTSITGHVLAFEKDLSPICLLKISKYPASVVLCLDNENPKSRNENMVNLCRTIW